MVTRLRYPKGYQFFDANGAPLALGNLNYYVAGTTTPQDTYSDSAGTVTNTNPIVLDGSGRLDVDVYLGAASNYKEVLTTASSTVAPWPDDNIPLATQPDWNATSGPNQILNKPVLAAVATSGSYTDLSNTPPSGTPFTGDSGSGGSSGLVPAPAAGDAVANMFLSAAGGWATPPGSSTSSATNLNVSETASSVAIGSSSGTGVTIPAATSSAAGVLDATRAAKIDGLATVATSGSYADLSNRPTIPAAQVNTDWNETSGVSQILNKPALATVATSGSYTDLLNQPAIPAAQVNSDWNATSGLAQILNKPPLGTAAVLNVPASGNASGSQVVLGTDTRLSDSRAPQSHASTHASGGSDPISISAGQVSGIPATLASQNLDNIARVGIGTTDTGNALSVNSPSVLFSNSGDMRATISKGASSNTAALDFQDSFTTRAQFGLLGNDNFTVSTSPDGSTFNNAIVATPSGAVSFPNTGGFAGDSGTGGASGLVPAPSAGAAAAGEFLKADGTWSIPPGTAQVNANWNATSGAAQILNKPALAASATTDTTNASNITSGTLAAARVDDLSATYLTVSAAGANNGVATLDAGGKLSTSQLPASLVGAVVYQGTWDASTNTPALASGVGVKGNYYVVSTAGTTAIDGINQWNPGDTIIFNGTAWNKIDGASPEVLSVAGLYGAITGSALKSALSIAASDVSGLATVATSGSYTDLSNKPAIPAAQVNTDWNATSGVSQLLNKPTLATVATSGSYTDLSNQPALGSLASQSSVNLASQVTGNLPASQVSGLAAVATTGAYSSLSGTPTIPAAQVNADWNATSGVTQILNKPSLAAVATSGSYTDLANQPTIPAAQVNADWNATSGVVQLLNKPTLAAVATSGSYTDLANQPTLGSLASQSSVNLASQVTGNLPASQVSGLAAVATTGAYASLSGTPTIPSYSVFAGATSGAAGTSGLVPSPSAGQQSGFLRGDGTWASAATAPAGSSGQLQYNTGSAFGGMAGTSWNNTTQVLSIGTLNATSSLGIASTSNSTTGVHTQNGTPIFQTWTPSGTTYPNLFLGANAGNFSISNSSNASYGGGNTGIGGGALQALTTGYNNVGVGYGSLSAVTSGFNNVGLGLASLVACTTGSQNFGLGTYALSSLTTGTDNICIGVSSGASISTNNSGTNAQYNVGIGTQSLYKCTTGYANIALGYQSQYNLTTAQGNIAVGRKTLNANVTGTYNVAIGDTALQNGTGSNNVAIGVGAAYNLTGNNSVAIGYLALNSSNSNNGNTGIGYNALTNASGSFNTSLGYDAGVNITSGSYHVAIGYQAMYGSGTPGTGQGNIAIGQSAMYAGNGGTGGSIAIGQNALSSATAAVDCIAIGSNAMQYTTSTAGDNIAIGQQALQNQTTAIDNLAIGRSSMQTLTTGGYNIGIGVNTLYTWNGSGSGYNVAIGLNSQYNSSAGTGNVSLGYYSAHEITTGSSNTAIGTGAFGGGTGGSITTGSGNTGLGYEVGTGQTSGGTPLTTGSYNTLLGYEADVNSASAQYRTAIGAGAVATADNSITLGRSSDTVLIPGTAKIASGAATPSGGSASVALVFGTTTGFGIYAGSGAPTVSAAQGSLYLRSDGSSTSTRLYVNTDGSTGWTNFTSAT
ncbi:MAG: beta strand repeat-containing protein [Rhodomicrobium sp.]